MTVDPTTLAKERQTSLGLYLTAKEAYDRCQADPEGVRILDVRTPEEYVFVGHAPMAWNIRLAFQSFEWDPAKKGFHWDLNPGFLPAAQAWANPGDTLLVEERRKNSGLPWTYEIDRERMLLPERETKKLLAGNEAD